LATCLEPRRSFLDTMGGPIGRNNADVLLAKFFSGTRLGCCGEIIKSVGEKKAAVLLAKFFGGPCVEYF